MTSSGQFRFSRLLLALLVIQLLMIFGLGVALFNVYQSDTQASDSLIMSESTSKYVLYIGTNDPISYLPCMPLEEARKVVNDICMKYADGFSVQTLQGAWADEKGIWTSEDTLVYYISGADEDAIISIMDDALEALSQKYILVEKENVYIAYYGGDD